MKCEMCIQHGPAGPSIRKTKICIQTTRENRNSIQWRNREKVNMKKNVRLKCFYLLNRLNIVRFFNVIRFAAMRRLILRQQRCICKRNRQKREEVVTIMKEKNWNRTHNLMSNVNRVRNSSRRSLLAFGLALCCLRAIIICLPTNENNDETH